MWVLIYKKSRKIVSDFNGKPIIFNKLNVAETHMYKWNQMFPGEENKLEIKTLQEIKQTGGNSNE